MCVFEHMVGRWVEDRVTAGRAAQGTRRGTSADGALDPSRVFISTLLTEKCQEPGIVLRTAETNFVSQIPPDCITAHV